MSAGQRRILPAVTWGRSGAYAFSTRASLRCCDLLKRPSRGRAWLGADCVPPAGLEPAAKRLEGACWDG